MLYLKKSFFYYIFIVGVIIFYLFLGYIYLHVSLYIVCVSYPLSLRSTMEIRRSHPCDFFLVLPILSFSFSYEILCCKLNISTTTTNVAVFESLFSRLTYKMRRRPSFRTG